VPTLSKNLDWIGVMDYDFHGSWDKVRNYIYQCPWHYRIILLLCFAVKSSFIALLSLKLKVTGHVAPLYYSPGDAVEYYNVDYSINYWIKSGASPDKIIMGIPLYGQSFTLASSRDNGLNASTYGPGEAGQFTRQGGVLSYYEICSQKWNVVQNPNGLMGPYAYNGNQWVSYDDIPFVKKKAKYIKDKGLGGGMIWVTNFEYEYPGHVFNL